MDSTLQLELASHSEPLAVEDALPSEIVDWLADSKTPDRLLWHQAETFRLLDKTPVVYNTSATGTGKTLASQLHLLRGPQVTVVVAPTNALVHQHAEDWTTFCRDAGLPHRVEGIDAAKLREIVPGLSEGQTNNARRLFELIRNRHQVLGTAERQPLVLVINPDLFYLATFFMYKRTGHRAAEAFLEDVEYLVIDELHYYSGLQLVAFFFTLGLWHLTGRFGDAEAIGRRRVCLLTATPEQDVETLFDGLRQHGLEIQAVDPTSAPNDAQRVVSLAPCILRLKSASTDVSAQITTTLQDWHRAIVDGQDAAALMDSLSGVSRVYGALHGGFGEHVRRITGPTPPDQRLEAEATALLLATPTVDLGYNFRSRDLHKKRQPLDRVIFEAPSRSRFWQRLGRCGRVLRAEHKDIPSLAVGLLPADVLMQLRDTGLSGAVSRQALAQALDATGERFDEWRVAPLLGEWSALAIARPLSHIYDRVSPEAQPIVKDLFETLRALFGESKRSFESLRRELRGQQEAEDISKSGKVLKIHSLSWLRDGHRVLKPTELKHFKQGLLSAPAADVRCLASEASAKYNAAMAFRGGGRLEIDVLAWDGIGLYVDRPAWIRLPLEECVRQTEFEVLYDERVNMLSLPNLPTELRAETKVLLRNRLTKKRTIRIARRLEPDEELRCFQGGVQADTQMCLEATLQEIGKPSARLSREITELISKQPLVYFLPWPRGRIVLGEMPQARSLWSVPFLFREGARERKLYGYIQQHAIIAHGLLEQHQRRNPREDT